MNEASLEIIVFKGDERSKEVAKHSYLWHQSPDEAIAFIKKVSHKDAEAIVLPCTAWRTFEAIAQLEAELNIPVITANQATIWSLAKHAALEFALHPKSILFDS
ncbi:hypothetical protein NSMS1_04270 [Nostoc sp. MS1]|nr:hypothetical protein NSMS1_04270 [Nostoc sp. MS1]